MPAEHPRSDASWASPVEPDAPSSEPPPSAGGQASQPIRWKVNAVLFVATVVLGVLHGRGSGTTACPGRRLASASCARSPAAGRSRCPLLAILLTHEFGHYIAARIHRVDASLPYFIPLPVLSPFGTMGAVISMRGRIRSRDALLDIGASGPLGGAVRGDPRARRRPAPVAVAPARRCTARPGGAVPALHGAEAPRRRAHPGGVRRHPQPDGARRLGRALRDHAEPRRRRPARRRPHRLRALRPAAEPLRPRPPRAAAGHLRRQRACASSAR